MRLVSISEAEPGMRLAKTLYRGEDGRILLGAGAELKQSYIEKIKALGFNYIHVLDPGEVEEDESLKPIKNQTRVKAVLALKKTMKQLKNNETVNPGDIKESVKEMLDQILNNSNIVYSINDINNHDGYTFTHSVNVCVISLLIGSIMDIHRNDLEILGIGAMLHDIGKLLIDTEILNKTTKLNQQEYESVKVHAKEGYEILKNRIKVSYVPAHVAYQHHEREDGSGYPRGLTGNGIHRFAKVVAVADVFDAMTSNRPYQNAVPTYTAFQEVFSNIDQKFDRFVVNCFRKVIAPYPVGSVLLLNNGDKVVVTNLSRHECMVKVAAGLHEGHTFNLYQALDFTVVKKM